MVRDISVTHPVGVAFDAVRTILFTPFDLGKWFIIGFGAFLAQLGSGGFGGPNFNYNVGSPPGPGSPTGDLSELIDWISQHIVVISAIALAVVTVGVTLTLLFLWLSSRGQFMLLDNVIHNRAKVAEPWRRFKLLAGSLFRLRLGLLALTTLISLLVIAAGLALAWSDIQHKTFTVRGVLALIGGVGLLSLIMLTFALCQHVLVDFVVPIMFRRNLTCMAGVRVFRHEILRGHVWTLTLFYLMRALLMIAAGIAAFVVTLLTCCLAALPYLGSVILLPITLFFRSYSLLYLEQFSPEWKMLYPDIPHEHDPFAPQPPAPHPPPAGPYPG